MSSDSIEVEGTVLAEERGGIYRVEIVVGDAHKVVLAKLSGRLVTNRIRVIPGDIVQLEIGIYDLSRGRITYRGRRHSSSS